LTAAASGATLTGGIDGVWRTDTGSPVKLNRAARDWNRAFFEALKGYEIPVTAAFSMELQRVLSARRRCLELKRRNAGRFAVCSSKVNRLV
jgi:hypothetical protein